MKKFGLGKGLDALLPLDNIDNPAPEVESGTAMLPLSSIIANPAQPRKNFDEAELAELAETIRQHGVLQPIVVEKGDGGNYVIVMGERRTRAARMAGLTEIPAIVRRFTPEESFTVALIENIQRANLNPIEEALAYRQLMEAGALSQEEAAAKVGKNRATFANTLRLLKLPDDMQDALKKGEISSGHARALLAADDEVRRELFERIRMESLSVRDAERIAAGRPLDAAAEGSSLAGGISGSPAAGFDSDAAPIGQYDTYQPGAGVPFEAAAAGITGSSEFQSDDTPGFDPITQFGEANAGPFAPGASEDSPRGAAPKRDSEYAALEQKFIEAFGTKVRLDGSFDKGAIKIDYYSKDDLERIWELVSGGQG